MAKRIALHAISTSASKYKKIIKPLLSFNADFYIRLFFIVKESAEECKNNALRQGYMHHCRNCQNRVITPLAHIETKSKRDRTISKYKFNNLTGNEKCEVCDGFMCLTGPFWIDDIHDEDFLNILLKELESDKFNYLKYNKRIKNFITNIKLELPLNNQVFSFDYARFCSDLTLSAPKLMILR
jgi:tRNA (guanine26-N2/guanine27-N2)-dimethyltransferase